MPERATIEAEHSSQVETLSAGEATATPLAVEPALPPQVPPVNNSVKTIRSAGGEKNRQTRFDVISRKYSNSYARQVAEAYQQQQADPPLARKSAPASPPSSTIQRLTDEATIRIGGEESKFKGPGEEEQTAPGEDKAEKTEVKPPSPASQDVTKSPSQSSAVQSANLPPTAPQAATTGPASDTKSKETGSATGKGSKESAGSKETTENPAAHQLNGEGGEDDESKNRGKNNRPDQERPQQATIGRRIMRYSEPSVLKRTADPTVLIPPTSPTLKPATPLETSPAFQPFVSSLNNAAKTEKLTTYNSSGDQLIGSDTAKDSALKAADAASPVPKNQAEGRGSQGKVVTMSQTATPAFDKIGFTKNIDSQLQPVPPVPDLSKVADVNQVGAVAGAITDAPTGPVAQARSAINTNLQSQRSATTAPLDSVNKDPLVTNYQGQATMPAHSQTPLPAQSTSQAAAVDPKVSQTLPNFRQPDEFSLKDNQKFLDQLDQGLTIGKTKFSDADLRNTKEARFVQAVDKKQELKNFTLTQPLLIQVQQAVSLGIQRASAMMSTSSKVGEMYGIRTSQLSQLTATQNNAAGKAGTTREQALQNLIGIYSTTKTDVNTILTNLETSVTTLFDQKAKAARDKFYGQLGTTVVDVWNTIKDNYTPKIGPVSLGFLGDANLTDRVLKDGGVGKLILNVLNDPAKGADGKSMLGLIMENFYLYDLKQAVSDISTRVDTEVTNAKNRVAQGKKDAQAYVDSLPAELQTSLAQEAKDTLALFNTLSGDIDKKAGELKSDISQKYDQAAQQLDQAIQQMLNRNDDLLAIVAAQFQDVIDTFNTLKDLLLTVIKKSIDVIGEILQNPGAFISNIGKAVSDGLKKFVEGLAPEGNPLNGTLAKDITSWLFSTVSAAGLTLPTSLTDVGGWLKLGLEILGIDQNYIQNNVIHKFFQEAKLENLEKKIKKLLKRAKKLSDDVSKFLTDNKDAIVQGIQTGVDLYQALRTGGVAAFIDKAREKVAAITQDLILQGIDQLKEAFVKFMKGMMEKALNKLLEGFLASALGGPVGTFINICNQVATVIQTLVKQAQKILTMVNGVLDSVDKIVKGDTDGAASYVKTALDSALDVVLQVVIEQLGLGDLPTKIKEVLGAVHDFFDTRIVQPIIAFIAKPFQNAQVQQALANMKDLGGDVGVAVTVATKAKDEQAVDLSGVKNFKQVISRKGAETAVSKAMEDPSVSEIVDTLEVQDNGAGSWNLHYVAEDDAGDKSGDITAGQKSEAVISDLEKEKTDTNTSIETARKDINDSIATAQAKNPEDKELANKYQKQLADLDTWQKTDLPAQETAIKAQADLDKLAKDAVSDIYGKLKEIKDKAEAASSQIKADSLDPELLALFNGSVADAQSALTIFNGNQERLKKLLKKFIELKRDWAGLKAELTALGGSYENLNTIIDRFEYYNELQAYNDLEKYVEGCTAADIFNLLGYADVVSDLPGFVTFLKSNTTVDLTDYTGNKLTSAARYFRACKKLADKFGATPSQVIQLAAKLAGEIGSKAKKSEVLDVLQSSSSITSLDGTAEFETFLGEAKSKQFADFGSEKFNPAQDAYQCWLLYHKAVITKGGITVLGRFGRTGAGGEIFGTAQFEGKTNDDGRPFVMLNSAFWSLAANDSWLQGRLDTGDDIWLIAAPEKGNIFGVVKPEDWDKFRTWDAQQKIWVGKNGGVVNKQTGEVFGKTIVTGREYGTFLAEDYRLVTNGEDPEKGYTAQTGISLYYKFRDAWYPVQIYQRASGIDVKQVKFN